VWAHASIFHRFTDTNVYTKPVALKYEKLATKYPWVDVRTDIFYSVASLQSTLVWRPPITKRRIDKQREQAVWTEEVVVTRHMMMMMMMM